MAYTPINWQTGDTITAEKLNKMDNGWGVERTQFFSETVTTVAGSKLNSATLAYTGTASPDTMSIAFDGVDYNCAKQVLDGDSYAYGASNPTDWTTYPFILNHYSGEWWLYTQVAGTYTISASGSDLQVSDNFKAAVNKSIDAVVSAIPFQCVNGLTTQNEIEEALAACRIVYFYWDGLLYFIRAEDRGYVTYFPENTEISVGFENLVFTVTNN